MENENEKLKEFVVSLFGILDPWDEDISSLDLQDLAEKHGVLVKKKKYKPCGDGCACAEFYTSSDFSHGVECFELADWITDKSINKMEIL